MHVFQSLTNDVLSYVLRHVSCGPQEEELTLLRWLVEFLINTK
jgi:hypothetical protein